MGEKRPTNSQLRLQRLAAEAEEAPQGILEIFAEPDEEPADTDAALTRADEDDSRRQ